MEKVLIETEKGTMEAELYSESVPKTVAFFKMLVEEGFYDQGMEFFKHLPGTLIQTGCPRNDGTGGYGLYIKCELPEDDSQRHQVGVLSMAHTARDMNSSQFFICLRQQPVEKFDGNNTCFGRVVKGIEVLRKLQRGDKLHKIELLKEDG